MRNGMLSILALTSVVMLAQAPPAPAPAAQDPAAPVAPAVPAQPFAQQRYVAEQAEIDRLITDMKPREALVRIEALLPTTPEPFDSKDLRGALDSYNRNALLVRAYSLAGKAAFAAGYWEKALEHDRKCSETSKQAYEDAKKYLTAAAANLRSMVEQNKKALEESAAYIEELKAKPNPDPGDKQQLELAEGLKATILSNEKWAKTCDDNVEMSRKTMEYYGPRADETEGWIKKETEQLESYRFPNDKVKYVEGIISSQAFMAQFQDASSKLQYLYRLNVLDPENKKVERAIAVLQGKPVGPEPKQPKPQPKKKAK